MQGGREGQDIGPVELAKAVEACNLLTLVCCVVFAQGGREGRDIGAVELAKAVEALGTGEILLNCIDCDGAKQVR